MFRTWMKTLLHCGFGETQVNHMTYEPMHSAQAKKFEESRKKKFICWSPLSQHTRSEDKCIFYPHFRVKSLRFELQVNIQLDKY